MTVLPDLRIKASLKAGEIVIHPFREEDLGSASFDVRLGRYFFRANRPERADGIFNIYSERSVREVWGSYLEAISAADWKLYRPGADWTGIRDDDRIIMLNPGANLLCHTIEFIGTRLNATTMMKARSSIGRSLINVCQCAGMGDVGYFNRWTMEIYNRSDYNIPLVVGRRVAQIVFLETGPTNKVYFSKYQGTANLAELEAGWHPDMMLPRLHVDRDVLSVVPDETVV